MEASNDSPSTLVNSDPEKGPQDGNDPSSVSETTNDATTESTDDSTGDSTDDSTGDSTDDSATDSATDPATDSATDSTTDAMDDSTEAATEPSADSDPAAEGEPTMENELETSSTPKEDAFSGVPAALRTTMERKGFSGLTKVQKAVVDAESDGRNLRISSQTGSGKTIAIGIALASGFLKDSKASAAPPATKSGKKSPVALVITPTRELAVQVREELSWLFRELGNIRIEVVVGGTDVSRDRRNLSRGPAIVVGTPGRMLDHVRSGALPCHGVQHVVLDEADQMLDMGFREELESILEQLPEDRRSHLVSATFPRQLKQLADKFQKDALHLEGTQLGAANADIQHVAHVVKPFERYAAVVNLLLVAHGERCLVFVKRRMDAATLAEKLAGDGFAVQLFSGELPQAQRTRTLHAFRSGIINILVSTDVAARGIDVPDISTVIHADVPENADIYTHRSGRTGRAGRQGRSVILLPMAARRHVNRVLRTAKVEAEWSSVPAAEKIRKAHSKNMRRDLHALLDGDTPPDEKQLTYAKLLLDGRDAVRIVATLLDMAETTLPREPMRVSAAPKDMPQDKDAKRTSGPTPGGEGGFVRFFINWGQRKGATASRIMAHVCRRGGVPGSAVGSIQVDPWSSSFEIAGHLAAEFETAAKKPDSREPELKIARHHGGRSDKPQTPRSAGRPAPTKRWANDKRKPNRSGGTYAGAKRDTSSSR